MYMQRVRFRPRSRDQFFSAVLAAAGTRHAIARTSRVSVRTMRDWMRGVHCPPLLAMMVLQRRYHIDIPKDTGVFDDLVQKQAARRLGAIARIRQHGNPGTPEGRRRGGLRAIARMRAAGNTRFVQRARIRRPLRTPALAEFVGAVLGDGGVTKFQVTISTGTRTDGAYALRLRGMVARLFGLRATVAERQKNVTTVTASSVALVEFLQALGVPCGNKIRQRINIPPWIRQHPSLLRACIRGLMDTDGSIYLDTHRYRDRTYQHMGMGFTSASPPLLASVVRALRAWGMHPTVNSRKHILLRREDEIIRYFDMVGTSNPKHRKRFVMFRRIRRRKIFALDYDSPRICGGVRELAESAGLENR